MKRLKEREEEEYRETIWPQRKMLKIRACRSYTKQKIYVERKTERDKENNDKFKLSVKETVYWLFYNASDILEMSKNWMKISAPVLRLMYVSFVLFLRECSVTLFRLTLFRTNYQKSVNTNSVRPFLESFKPCTIRKFN